MTFSDKINQGIASEHDFNVAVGEWENTLQDSPLSRHLGLTYDEYVYICLEPNFSTAVKMIKFSREQEL